MIPAGIAEAISPVTGAVRHAQQVGGGCISNATRVEAAGGIFFLKYGSGEAGATFLAEAEGLRALREAAAGTGLGVPAVLQVRNTGPAAGFLLLEWVEPGRTTKAYWEGFGAALAALHRARAPRTGEDGPYGFGADNFIGRLPQRNRWHREWPAFFREERLVPQMERARQAGRWQPAWSRYAERLLARLEELLPASPHPSMLHGDLWSGNAMATADGRAVLIDPAAYVGDREADLGMTELFGGFDERFYRAYDSAWPLEEGQAARRDLYNLYHLLNHLNHFGGGYAGAVEGLLRRFGG